MRTQIHGLTPTPELAHRNRSGRAGAAERIADLLASQVSSQQLALNLSLSGNTLFPAGQVATPYIMGAAACDRVPGEFIADDAAANRCEDNQRARAAWHEPAGVLRRNGRIRHARRPAAGSAGTARQRQCEPRSVPRGAVKGRTIYRRYPVFAINGADDLGRRAHDSGSVVGSVRRDGREVVRRARRGSGEDRAEHRQFRRCGTSAV